MGFAGQIRLIHGGLKGSAADILMPDTTARLQGSSGVQALVGQKTNTILM